MAFLPRLTVLLSIAWAWTVVAAVLAVAAPGPSKKEQNSPARSLRASPLGSTGIGTQPIVPRNHLGLWKPFSGNLGIDTKGLIFPSDSTAYMAVELEGQPAEVQLIFGNQSDERYSVIGASVSTSSQLASDGYTGGTPGVTPYDEKGKALSSMRRVTFADYNGSSDAGPANLHRSCLMTSKTGEKSTTKLYFDNFPHVSPGMLVSIPAQQDRAVGVQPVVTATSSNSISIKPPLENPLAPGEKVCFLPTGTIVPASSRPPIQSLVRSDWIRVPSYQRRDSPLAVGGTVRGDGISEGTAVTGFTSRDVTLSAPTTADIPQNTAIFFCRHITTASAVIPTYSLPFASIPSSIVAGMHVWRVGSTVDFVDGQGFPSPVTVDAVRSDHLVLSAALSSTMNSGYTYVFYRPLKLSAPANAGDTSLTVTDMPKEVVDGMFVFGTGIGGSTGRGVNFLPTTKIVGIFGKTLRLSAANIAPLQKGDTVFAAVALTSNAASTISSTAVSSSSGVYPGAAIIGAGIPSGTFAVVPGRNAITLSKFGVGIIPSGTGLDTCDFLRTRAKTSQGATTLPFETTSYPKSLLLVRLKFGGPGVNYWLPGPNANQALALWTGAVGGGRMEAGLCGAGRDGVADVGAISNTEGGCRRSPFFSIWGIKVRTLKRGVVVANFGDSHFAGDTTIMNNANMTARAAITLSSPDFPVWAPNLAFGGVNAATFLASAWPLVQELKPAFLTMAGYSFNGLADARLLAKYNSRLGDIVRYVHGYGGKAILLLEYQRQVFGCNATLPSAEAYRLQARTEQLSPPFANSFLNVIDLASALGSREHADSIEPALSTDCIHANDKGNEVAAAILRSVLKRQLGK